MATGTCRLPVAGCRPEGINPETIKKARRENLRAFFIAHQRSMVQQQLSGGLSQSSPSLTRTS